MEGQTKLVLFLLVYNQQLSSNTECTISRILHWWKWLQLVCTTHVIVF